MTSNTDASVIEVPADRQEITELCVRYTTALDTKARPLPESCFSDTTSEWRFAERIQASFWREGNRAVVAR